MDVIVCQKVEDGPAFVESHKIECKGCGKACWISRATKKSAGPDPNIMCPKCLEEWLTIQSWDKPRTM